MSNLSDSTHFTHSNKSINRNRYSFIIFDWDGTVMDSIARIVSSLQVAAQLADIEIPDDKTARSVIGMSLGNAIKNLFPNANEAQAKFLFDSYRTEYREHSQVPTPIFEGAETLLQKLRVEGLKAAIATGKGRGGLDTILNDTQLGHYFVDSICADESQSKPNPAMLYTLLKRNNVKLEDCVMIGDTIHDLAMAKAAGMDSIGITLGVNNKIELAPYDPVIVVDDYQQLTNFLLGHDSND